MSKINTLGIDIGHNVSYDGGAIGIKREDDLNREVGSALIIKCRNAGINVINCSPHSAESLYNSLNQRCVAANNAKADFFISIHHNACPNGHGAEAFCITGGLSEKVGNIILQEICSLGLSNRGVKDRRNLFVINQTVMPALLIECAFCDSEEDMKGYEPIAVADAIFRGICRAFDISVGDACGTSDSDGTSLGDSGGDMGEVAGNGRTSPQKEYYTVVSGDTLWQISQRFGNSVDWLVQANGIENRDLIFVGQILRIK